MARETIRDPDSAEPRQQWAVRWHSEHGSHISPAETRAQAEAWASSHAELPGCWAELLTRTIPSWRLSKTYPNDWKGTP